MNADPIVRVEGSLRHLGRPVLFGLTVGICCGILAGLVGWAYEGWRFALAMALASLIVFVLIGVVQSIYWLLRAGRTSYEVAEGQLIVRRRGRVVRSWPCEILGEIEVGNALKFRHTLWSDAYSGLPELRVCADEGSRIGSRIDYRTHLGWPILLMSKEEVDSAQCRIVTAVEAATQQGAAQPE